MAAQARHPFSRIRTSSSGKLTLYRVVLVWHLQSADTGVRDAWALHPLNSVATGGAGTVNAKDGIVAPHEVAGAMNAMPRMPFPHVDAPSIIEI